jgi:DNA repair exonuclease SbcCD nuclease subunit
MEDFLGKDIQYWALGHIHKRMVMREAEPTVVYPGNIQGRDISESGEKGCMLVHVDGGNVTPEFVPTQEIIWKEVAADITGKSTLGELIDSVKAEIPPDSVIGLNIVGKGALNKAIRQNPSDIAERVEEETGCPTTIRKVTCTDDIDLEKIAQGETLASAVVKAGESFYAMSEEELLDAICCTAPSKDVRIYLEYFAKHGRLHDLVREAQLSAVSRILEGSE